MEAKIVVGLGFGDEGKGITTDFLASKVHSPTLNVRFNGGQQAGHTVVIDGKRHTYATFGSGTGRGLPTFISEHCTFYPPNALNEHDSLIDKGFKPSLYVHPLAKLTTYWDVAWGRLRERICNHGSCGIGIGATMTRTEQSPYKLFVVDLKHEGVLGAKLDMMHRYYREKLKELETQGVSGNLDDVRAYFYEQVNIEENRFNQSLKSEFISELASYRIVSYDRLRNFRDFIFEGAQGIMLDMEHGIFPNVTYSNTTSKNALSICEQLGISAIDIYYVTRCYSTRHGEGWTPETGQVDLINNKDEHNVHNEWQKVFKTGELDYSLLAYALNVDSAHSWGYSKNLVITCMDQREKFIFDYSQLKGASFDTIYTSWSPDSKDFKKVL